MEKNKRMTMIIIAGVLLLTVVGVAFAYFGVSVINGTRQNLSATTVENVNLSLEDNNSTSFSGQLNYGSTITKNLKLINEGGATKVALYFQDLINTYTAGSFTYTLSTSTSDNGTYTNVVSDVAIPRRSKASSTAKITEIEMPATTTRYYKITITYNHLETVDQTRDLTARFNTGFTIKSVPKTIAEAHPNGDYLKDFCVANASGTCTSETYQNYYVLGNSALGDITSDTIKVIKTVASTTPTSGTTFVENGSPWDVSVGQNGSVMAWVTSETYYDYAKQKDATGYTLYIGQEGGVIAPSNISYLFSEYEVAQTIDLSNFNTDYVTNMSHMFDGAAKLYVLNQNNFDTSNVTDMSYMFNGCKKLTGLNLNSFDTSNVTNMTRMYQNCSGLQSLNLSSFDTANVSDMSFLFNSCSGLTALDISSFDTSNVTSMASMFATTTALQALNVASFNTACVTNMSYMFSGCGIASIDVSNFDTASVQLMNYMFANIKNVETLDLRNFDTSNVTNMSGLFNQTNSMKLKTIHLESFNFDKVQSYTWMIQANGISTQVIAELTVYVNQNGKNFIEEKFPDHLFTIVLV